VLVCALLFHAATNVLNDYFDFERGVDQSYPFEGSSGVLTRGLLSPREVFAGGCALFGLGVTLGMILVYVRGLPMLALGTIGLIGGYLYSGGPKGYKYLALGDVFVFVLMGPLMVFGSYFALTANYGSGVALWASLPVGALVAAILVANNHRDATHDAAVGVKTLATMLGFKASKVEYCLLVLSAYLGVILMVLVGILSSWSLLVFITVPLALANLRTIQESRKGREEQLAKIVLRTAQLHLLFGSLLVLGVILGVLAQP
jgi:1,4-dihydroxy-2-naphthoate octaprenyltransferase